MRKIDVSVVLNMHREALYLRPTLLSLDACANEAKNAGINVELIAVFDRPDQDTLEVFHRTPLKAFEQIKTTTIDVGSLGLARNAGIDLAEGEFVWTSDGDDLVSRNSIVELVKTARNHPHSKIAVFIDFLVAFGESYHVARYVSDQWLTAADFAYHHPYVSRIFIKRDVFQHLSYRDLKVTTGFAYEDWDFNVRLFASGFEFLVAQNTIIFYRQRSNSLLKQANAVSARMVPHSALFEPKTFVAAMADARKRNPDWQKFMRERQAIYERKFVHEMLASETLVGYVTEAAQLDPEVEPIRIEAASNYCPVPWDSQHWGFQLERFYQLVGDQPFSDVLLLPWLKPGGAEKYILQVLGELWKFGACRRLLVLSGQAASRHEWASLLPKGSVFVDVFNAFPMLDDAGRDAMIARALLAVAAEGARLHIKASPFSHRLMDSFGSVLSSTYKVVYYRFCDDSYAWRNERVNSPWAVAFLRRQLNNIHLLISDCGSIVAADWARLGAHKEKYQTIYALCASQEHPSIKRLPNKRLLWASRVSAQKRPDLLGKIATALRQDCPEIVIEVYGQIENNYHQQRLFDVPGVIYRGSYDGFQTLPIDRFDAFIYTSAFDGLPNVILEVLGAGLPVIAPDVGGIGEAVIEGETGFLVPDLVDENALVEAYVDAVRRLYGDWDRTVEIVERGRQLIADRHGEAKFRQRVSDVFELALHVEGGQSMSSLYFYADDASQKILAGDAQKIISIGGDFGYGNFGDVLQHINALRAIKKTGRFATVSVMAANAINSQAFPSFVPEAYKTDAVIFVSSYPLILVDTDPQLTRVAEIRNVAGLGLYGGGFLNSMWGDFVLSVVEHFLRLDQKINYWVSGQQITSPFEARVLEHIKAFHPKLFGVRDEVSLRLLAERGYDADFSFDDATEALEGLSDRLSIRQGQGLALHLNSSDYTANTSLADGLGRELASVASQDAARHEVTVFQAFRDSRQDVFDSSETIKRLDYLFPFHEYRTIDLVGLLFDQSSSNKQIKLDLALGYSCSYHVTLWLQLAGIPCWLRSSNSFYDQKSRALQVSQGLDEFLRNPKLADHTSNLERRATWNDKLQRHLSSIDPIENCLRFESVESGPAPWSFFYKGHPTLQDKLSSAEKDNLWLKSRAEVAERDLGATRSENAELHGRVETLSTQISVILASRSWRLTRGLRALGRLFRGEFGAVFAALRQRFTRHRS